MNLFNSRGTSFELGYLRDWIKCRIGQLVHRKLLAPVIRNKDGVRPDSTHDQHGKDSIAATRHHAHSFAVTDVQFHRGVGMDLNIRLGTLLDEEPDAACLIAGKILVDHAAAREY